MRYRIAVYRLGIQIINTCKIYIEYMNTYLRYRLYRDTEQEYGLMIQIMDTYSMDTDSRYRLGNKRYKSPMDRLNCKTYSN